MFCLGCIWGRNYGTEEVYEDRMVAWRPWIHRLRITWLLDDRGSTDWGSHGCLMMWIHRWLLSPIYDYWRLYVDHIYPRLCADYIIITDAMCLTWYSYRWLKAFWFWLCVNLHIALCQPDYGCVPNVFALGYVPTYNYWRLCVDHIYLGLCAGFFTLVDGYVPNIMQLSMALCHIFC